MFQSSVPLAAALLLAALPGFAPAEERPSIFGRAQRFVEQRILVRLRPPKVEATDRPVRWVDKKGPRCVPLADMAGALVQQPDVVDLVLAGGKRVRAQLRRDCPALNFYAGFYLKPTGDGKVCADRDAVHSRTGRACPIDEFRRLVAKR